MARYGKKQKVWLCGHLKAAPNPHWCMKSETFCSLTFLKSCIHPLCIYYRRFLEWFLTAFLQIKYLWSCFYWLKKEKKNITIIINSTNSTSDFYFGHFIGAKDIPQSCMIIFFS